MNPKTLMVVNFMDANLHRKLSLDELARAARISRSHLCRLFKTEAGMPPGQYLQKLRMERASRLLVTTLLSVKQIQFEVGYIDKSLFVRHFRRANGLSPSEYRAKFHALVLTRDNPGRQDRNAS